MQIPSAATRAEEKLVLNSTSSRADGHLWKILGKTCLVNLEHLGNLSPADNNIKWAYKVPVHKMASNIIGSPAVSEPESSANRAAPV